MYSVSYISLFLVHSSREQTITLKIVDEDSKQTYSLSILVSARADELLRYANRDQSQYCLYYNTKGILNLDQSLLSQGIKDGDQLICNQKYNL